MFRAGHRIALKHVQTHKKAHIEEDESVLLRNDSMLQVSYTIEEHVENHDLLLAS